MGWLLCAEASHGDSSPFGPNLNPASPMCFPLTVNYLFFSLAPNSWSYLEVYLVVSVAGLSPTLDELLNIFFFNLLKNN